MAIGLINAVAAYALAHLVSPGAGARRIDAYRGYRRNCAQIIALVLCIRGWRSHFRRRRMVS